MNGNDDLLKDKQLESALENNMDVVLAFLRLMERLKAAGLVEALDYINRDVIPDNMAFFVRAFTSKDMLETISKSGNTLISMLFLLSNREMSDMIKAISFNAQGIASAVHEGASGSHPLSVLKIMGIFKDPEVAAGLNAMISGLKAFGNVLKKLD
jgi:uncharacterized protein YjgD (DUF1641 family)